MSDTVSAALAVLAGVAAALSAGFAGWQLRQNRVQESRRALFEHLREIETRLSVLLSKDTAAISTDVLRCYREKCEISSDGMIYLSFLNALDMLAFARHYDIVDSKLSDEYVKTLFRSHVISLTFVDDLQECCGDSKTYEHLRKYILVNHNNSLKEERNL